MRGTRSTAIRHMNCKMTLPFLAVLMFTGPALADKVGINFVGGVPDAPQPAPIESDQFAGVYSSTYNQRFWNNAFGASGSLAPKGDAGTGTAVSYGGFSVSWSAFQTNSAPVVPYEGNPDYGTGGPPVYRLMLGYLDATANKPATVKVDNIPSRFTESGRSYALVVYFKGYNRGDKVNRFTVSGAQSGEITIYGLDKIEKTNPSSWTLVPASSNTDEGEDTPEGNYVVFSGLKNSTITLTATGAFASDGESRAAINGIQIVPDEAAALLNISTRGRVGAGNDVMIAGFIIGGTQEARVVVRVLGPTLGNPSYTNPPLPNSLQDPRLEIYDANGWLIAANDNFAAASQQQQRYVRNSGLAPPDKREPAVGLMLAPTSYTAIVRGAADSSGIALVEVYKVS